MKRSLSKFVILVAVILFTSIYFAGYIEKFFDISKFSGQYPIYSVATLEQTKNWYSVEGVVYEIATPQKSKYLKQSEVSSNVLSSSKVVGLLGLTANELSQFNGQNGSKSLVAVNGIIYDLSTSKLWQSGIHKNLHTAGQDLTYYIIKSSPHGLGVIKQFPSYGVLVFNPTQLSSYDGKKEKKIYFSVYGIIYDATNSKKFSGGDHYGHTMGVDLTTEILSQPNHVNLLSKLYRIGLFVFTESDLKKFDGKSGKPFVMVDNKVYDVSKKPVTAGKVLKTTVEKEWLLVGFRLN